MIALGVGGLCVAINTYESPVPTFNTLTKITKSQVEKKAGGSLKSEDFSKIGPYNFPEMARRGYL